MIAVQPCHTLDAIQLRAMSPAARADALQAPTIVTNLFDRWPADLSWLEMFDFDSDHPDNPPDESRRDAREAMNRIFEHRYSVPVPFHERTARLRISVSHSTGPGVTFCNHGFSWLGLLKGQKEWFFAPHTSSKPPEPSCEPLAAGAAWPTLPPTGATHTCVQRAGEAIVVPTAWWHATCNVGATFAFGGEDSCDVAACDLSSGGHGSRVCPILDQMAACHAEAGARQGALERQQRRGRLEQSMLTVKAVDARVWGHLGLSASERVMPQPGKSEL